MMSNVSYSCYFTSLELEESATQIINSSPCSYITSILIDHLKKYKQRFNVYRIVVSPWKMLATVSGSHATYKWIPLVCLPLKKSKNGSVELSTEKAIVLND